MNFRDATESALRRDPHYPPGARASIASMVPEQRRKMTLEEAAEKFWRDELRDFLATMDGLAMDYENGRGTDGMNEQALGSEAWRLAKKWRKFQEQNAE